MIRTQLMPFNSSSDPNSETEYDNPSSMGLDDMRGLLVRLETLHIENPVSMSRLDVLIDNTQLWTLRTDLAEAGFLLRNEISDKKRIEFFELGYMVHYLNPDGEGIIEKIISKNISLFHTTKNLLEDPNINHTVKKLLKTITVKMDAWYEELYSDPTITSTNSQSHSNKSSEHRQLLPAPGGGTSTVPNTRRHTNTSSEQRKLLPAPGGGTSTVPNTRRHTNTSSEQRKLLPAPGRGTSTVPNTRRHTNTSSERRQGSIAWLDERGLHYIKHNDKRVNFVPYYDQNKKLPPPWTWYQRHGLIYFTPDRGYSEYTLVQSPNSRVDPHASYPGYTRVGDLFVDDTVNEHLSGVDNLQGLLMCLQTMQIENPLSTPRLDTKMDSTTIYSFSGCCEETGFLLQRHNISNHERIEFFDLGYMLVHDHYNHKRIKPEEIFSKCRQLQMTITNLMQVIQSNTQKSRLITINKYITEYLASYFLTTYSATNHGVTNSIDTSDLAAPVDQVRPCRCRGCTGCDGKPGHCRCIGRCRCVHDADADAREV